jgi:uncharacterized Zn-finger protein
MFACGVCAEKFARKDILNRHVKSAHDNQKFVCDICDKSFSRKDNMNRHMKIAHGNTRCESVLPIARSANVVPATPI